MLQFGIRLCRRSLPVSVHTCLPFAVYSTCSLNACDLTFLSFVADVCLTQVLQALCLQNDKGQARLVIAEMRKRNVKPDK